MKKSTKMPGPRGFEHLAKIRSFIKAPSSTLLSLALEYGKIFAFGLRPFRIIYLIGPNANHVVIGDKERNFRCREAYDLLVPIGGEAALIVSDGEAHRRRRQLLQPAFHKNYVEHYFNDVLILTDRALDSWRPGQTIDIYQALRLIVFKVVTESLFGKNLGAHSSMLYNKLETMLRFVNLWPWLQIRLDLAGTLWHRVKRARRIIDAIVYTEINRRCGAPTTDDDVLTLLLRASSSDGGGLRKTEVRDLVVSLLTAAYDTTSATLGWLVYAMLKDPPIWARAEREYDEFVENRGLTSRDLSQLKYIDWAIYETLRVYSPIMLGLRKVVNPFTFDGYDIPAHSIVAYSPYVTHHLPSVWSNPEAFSPARWDPDSEGYEAPSLYNYVPFGGGVRRCLGEYFAQMEIKIIICRLLHRIKLTLLHRNVKAIGFSAMHPEGGVWVHIDNVRPA